MKKALVLSLILHFLLTGALLWSSRISLILYKKREKEMDDLGSVQVSLIYKATNTAMRKGDKRKDLPPPKLPKLKKKTDRPTIPTAKKKKPKPKPKPKRKDPTKGILEKLRAEIEDDEEDDRKIPRIDNFPMTEDGKEDSLGTGGRSNKELTPAQQALHSAMKRHFDMPNAAAFRKINPNARGRMDLKIIGVGNQFQIVSLATTVSSGFSMLDMSCEKAIRKALEVERFSGDVISELSGKETVVICRP